MRGADLELVKVTKRYGRTVAVDGVDLKIPAGTYCCLLGPSGCGKTSTLRMVAGHEAVSDGDVLLGPANVTDRPPAKRGTAMMFQSYALFPHLSVTDNVAFSLMDEPLSALDPFLRIKMRAELKRLQAELGISFIHVTHSQEEAMALADLAVVMNGGRIEQAGPPQELFARPATEFVARFIGGHNVVRLGGALATLRADRLRLSKVNGAGLPDGSVEAVVQGVEYQGATVHVAFGCDLAPDMLAWLPEAAFFADPVAPGDRIAVAWADADIHPLSTDAAGRGDHRPQP